MQELMQKVERDSLSEKDIDFNPGDTVAVSMKIREGDKERIQIFQGVVMKIRGSGLGKSVTVRKASGNVYVEKVFPFHSPLISGIKVIRRGRVRRSKLYYLRSRTGKATRIKEKK
jgi:large subunit ribosomal protein L19